ncbi:hypothetical protein D3C81_1915950 [compost metagenome]
MAVGECISIEENIACDRAAIHRRKEMHAAIGHTARCIRRQRCIAVTRRTDRRGTEIVRQEAAEANFQAAIQIGIHITQRKPVMADRIDLRPA